MGILTVIDNLLYDLMHNSNLNQPGWWLGASVALLVVIAVIYHMKQKGYKFDWEKAKKKIEGRE